MLFSKTLVTIITFGMTTVFAVPSADPEAQLSGTLNTPFGSVTWGNNGPPPPQYGSGPPWGNAPPPPGGNYGGGYCRRRGERCRQREDCCNRSCEHDGRSENFCR